MNLQKKNDGESKFPKVSDAQWIQFATSLQYGDTLFVSETNFVGSVIQWGTESDIDMGDEKVEVCHVFDYEGLGIGQTREADGKKVSAKHCINEYRERVQSGKCRLIVYRVPDLTDIEKKRIQSFWELHEKEDYNMMENVWYGVYGLILKAKWYKFAGWISKHIMNPAYNGKNYVCSQASLQKFKGSDRIYLPIVKDKPIEQMTPEELIARIPRVAKKVMDTAHLA